LHQDATFIYAELDHCRKDTPRGDLAKTRRDKDGKIMSKNGKRLYAVIKNVFHAGLMKVTTLQRVRVKNMLAAF